METRENNLKVYLKEQMEEYHQECESIKALYADLLEHIEECRDQIRRQKEQEDPGFALLSPLGEKLKEDASAARLEAQIEAYEKQKGKYLQQIHFYEEKTAEMKEQLEEFARNEALKAQWEEELRAEQEMQRPARPAADDAVRQTTPPEKPAESVSGEQLEKTVENAVRDALSQDRAKYTEACAYLTRKLAEIKEYVQLDPMRSRVELDRLMQYVKQLEEGETCV